MDKKVVTVSANGIAFHCELRGAGPTLVLIPDGGNDCEPYDQLSKQLADNFTVLTFDMRGGSRSIPDVAAPVTPKILADDVIAIVDALDLPGKLRIYGCSSGGQAALALGKYYASRIESIVVHEAALQEEAPLENSGFSYFQNLMTFALHLSDGLVPMDLLVGNAKAALSMSQACRERKGANAGFWAQHYLGHVDRDTYSEQDFDAMPPVDFTVGSWSPAWLVQANLVTAARGARSVTWMGCAHHPEQTCPEAYADFLIKKFGH